MEAKRIILVIPTLKQGGAERVISLLADNWCINNNEIHLVLLAKGEYFYEINKKVHIHELNFENINPLLKIFYELITLYKLRNILHRTNPDFVLCFMTKYNILTLIASRFLKPRVYVSDRSNPKTKLSFSLELLRKITYKWATGIIAQTSLAKEIIEKQTKNFNIQIIPNPVREIRTYNIINKEKIILCVGRLVNEKGQKYLLEAFAKLNHKDWKLVLLGDGPLLNDLKKLARKLDLMEQLILPGAVTNVDEWLAKSSIFAFPSISEGFPNALLEAMTAGLPCISFDCDAGPRDIIKNGINGILIELYNIDSFSEKLELLINNIELRTSLGIEAKKIREEYDVSIICSKIYNFCSSKSLEYENRN